MRPRFVSSCNLPVPAGQQQWHGIQSKHTLTENQETEVGMAVGDSGAPLSYLV